ncbi:sodium:proton antiporter [Vibrio galatheae]|uniref:Sodium:proton antiporter n=1 Tax=Vibrio galatheae TaxID=579748 RepID=A0A0F4NQL9_9VIBR|nr:cation:proton antiporter [Vibrio galatheae]KJY84401.1 sodium:proton antiporter [Vibrio galatheae]
MDLEYIYAVMSLIAGIVFFYTLIAKRIENSGISGPIVYVCLGLLLGEYGFGVIGGSAQANEIRLFADLTLALILFSDAANSNLAVLKQKAMYPIRMLLLGLPGAIVLGTLAAVVLLDVLSFVEAAILATMLAATDAALGKAVISNPKVPAPVSEGLNVESGLNDGLCVPVLLLLIAVATSSSDAELTTSHALMVFVEELGIGAIVGLSLAFIGAKLLQWSASKDWLSEVWAQLTVGAIALCSFGLAQTLHGSGYIAAFTGGLLFGHLASRHKHQLVLTTESIAELLAMLTWILFGAAVIGQVIGLFSANMIIYALVSLTVVRILPIYLSFLGTSVSAGHRWFMGWFGPRGLASIVFTIIVLDADLPGGKFIALTVTCTVILSLVLHGITAKPLAERIGK